MRTLKVHGTKPANHPFPLVSWLIRLAEWSDISHVIMELEDGRIYHARFNEVRFERLEDFKKNAKLVHTYEFQIPEELYEAMVDWCEEYKGIKKGYFSKLFGALVPHLTRRLLGVYIKNLFVKGMEKNAICSELLRFLALRFWNFTVPSRPYQENFSTGDIMKLMRSNGAKELK
jgi:hypothetical protein